MLAPDQIAFIQKNLNASVQQLALKYHNKIENLPFLLDQIYCRQKIKLKLPTWFANQEVVFPNRLCIEQCSSETTAQYKANLFEGNLMVDITGGFGVDIWAFSKHFNKLHYVERNSELANGVLHNLQQMNINHVDVHVQDGLEFLEQTDLFFDLIYLDPARRDENQKKVFAFEDCQPDVLKNLPLLFSKSNRVLIKASPLIDISEALKSLPNIIKIYVVALHNECKEVLFELEKNAISTPEIVSINLPNEETFIHTKEEETQAESTLSKPLNFLYEPNVSLMKSAPFRLISQRFSLSKLNKNTHLYTSEVLMENFPGRTFKIDQIMNYSPKKFLTLGIKKANITTRNFFETTDQVKKKLKLSDGGDVYIFVCNGLNDELLLLICSKVLK